MRSMLTTIDNPFNPFTKFIDWYAFDERKGYNSSSLLARIANVSDDLGQNLNEEETENAIDAILEMDFDGIYERFYEDGTRGRVRK